MHDHAHVALRGRPRPAAGGARARDLGFMAGEVVAGVLADSLALLSDAAHMLTDAAAIALALVASPLAERPPRAGSRSG